MTNTFSLLQVEGALYPDSPLAVSLRGVKALPLDPRPARTVCNVLYYKGSIHP